MDWKELGAEVAKIGLPLLGAVLPIPGGVAIGTALASAIGAKSTNPSDIFAKLSASADALQKAKEFELTHQEKMLQLGLDFDKAMRQADSVDILSVNTSIQAEAKSEHWAQWAWRPYNGFLYGTMIILCYFALPLAKIVPPLIPSEVWLGWGALLGITAWHRGIQQVEKTRNDVK
jgi:hypothetical protein